MDLIMNDDMTYQETARIKSNIQSFVEKIKELSQEFDFDFQQLDGNFFSFIAKHIVFFKYLFTPLYFKLLFCLLAIYHF